MTEQSSCIFCKIGAGGVPSEKLFDDGRVFAIRDLYPKAPTHVLVIPYEHIGALTHSSGAHLRTAAHCLEVVPQVAKTTGVDSYRLVVNQGADAGQEVPHFHLHVLGGRSLGSMG